MTRKSFKLALCSVLVFSLMGLAACGGSKEESVVKPTSAETQAQAADEEETKAVETKAAETTAAKTTAAGTEASETDAAGDSGTSGSGKYATVADFANSPEVQSQLETQKKSLDSSGMDIAITGEDNKLIYTFTYLEIENQEGMAEALEQGLEAQRSTFVSVAKSIKLAVDVEDPIVVVEYLDSKGEVIYSAEFTAE